MLAIWVLTSKCTTIYRISIRLYKGFYNVLSPKLYMWQSIIIYCTDCFFYSKSLTSLCYDDAYDQFSPHLQMCLVASSYCIFYPKLLPNFYQIFTKILRNFLRKFLPRSLPSIYDFYKGNFKHKDFFIRGFPSTRFFSVGVL